jgi:hypothetical protein
MNERAQHFLLEFCYMQNYAKLLYDISDADDSSDIFLGVI